MTYRKEYNKIFKKIQGIAQKGKDGVFDYYVYIDELVDNAQYVILEDVMKSKFSINIGKYPSINDFKKKSYQIVREKTPSKFQQQYNALLEYRNVYQVGLHFYDKDNNHYLGDIKEVEEVEDWIAYKDPSLSEKQDQIRVINLEVTSGLPLSIIDGIPPFVNDPKNSIDFVYGDLVRYGDNIYECVIDYSYNVTTPIIPTDLNYWLQIYSPTYSLTIIDDDDVKLITKYNLAIDIVKSFIYLDPSSSDYVGSNYMDDYFE